MALSTFVVRTNKKQQQTNTFMSATFFDEWVWKKNSYYLISNTLASLVFFTLFVAGAF